MRLISKTGAVTRPILLPVCRAMFDLYFTAWQVKRSGSWKHYGHQRPQSCLIMHKTCRRGFGLIPPPSLTTFIIWLAPWAGKNSDWLPERARSYLARSGPPTVSRDKNLTESQIINPLLTMLFRSRWLDMGLVLWTLTPYRSIPSWPHDHTSARPPRQLYVASP